MPVLFLLCINVLFVDLARALSVTYSYEGNSFVELEGEPDIFSTSDKVIAQFTLDCVVAHAEGNCRNLHYADYAELGAVQLEPLSFSAGPAKLPTADGSVEIARFIFSTDSSARIVDWDMDLSFADSSGFINVDTDNSGDGIDSAAASDAFATVKGQPGIWGNDLPPIESDFDIEVKKSVDNPTPTGPQQTVEFTVEVRNIGDVPANDVVVEDKLPPELSIPEGMAAFTSRGYYDASSGRWEVGDLGAGLTPEILKIPVIITTESQPICVLNTASSKMPGDTNTSNDSSSSALRRPDIERCVDLGVEFTQWNTASNACVGTGEMWYSLRISNAGPDEARHVVLEISETLYQIPGFSVDEENPNCDGLRCTWVTLGAGQAESVVLSTGQFQVDGPTEYGIQAVVSSDVEDYKIENNKLVEQRTIEPFREVSCEGGGMDFGGGIGGGGGGCFIATAIYGSANHPNVKTLRGFRDDVLLKTSWGRALIEFYYRHSPGLACYIGEHASLRMLTRGLLAPVVLVVAYPWQVLLVLFAAVVSLVLVWRRANA